MEPQLTHLQQALAATSEAVHGIGDDRWDAPTPCAKWNVRQLVQHTVGVMANFAGAAAGTGIAGDPMEFDLGADPAAACDQQARACVTNWTQRGELDSTVSLGESEFPGSMAITINTLDAYVHAWDIARATGQDIQLDADICAPLLEFARQVVPETPREGDNFHAVVPTPADAHVQDELLGYLGRTP